MWGKAADVPKIDRLRHVSFCITLTVSVKRNKREKHKINKEIETLYVRNTLIAAFFVFGG